MSQLPQSLNAASNELYGYESEQLVVQHYIHKFLRDFDSGPVIGIAVYDVTRALASVRGKEPNASTSTDSVAAMFLAKRQAIDVEYARSLSTERLFEPGLIFTMVHPVSGKEYPALADGNHRAYGRWCRGWSEMPCHLLTPAESDAFRLPIREALAVAAYHGTV